MQGAEVRAIFLPRRHRERPSRVSDNTTDLLDAATRIPHKTTASAREAHRHLPVKSAHLCLGCGGPGPVCFCTFPFAARPPLPFFPVRSPQHRSKQARILPCRRVPCLVCASLSMSSVSPEPYLTTNPRNHNDTALPPRPLPHRTPSAPAASSCCFPKKAGVISCMSKGAFPFPFLCTLALRLIVVVVALFLSVAEAQNHLVQDAMATNKPVPMIGKPAPDFKGTYGRRAFLNSLALG